MLTVCGCWLFALLLLRELRSGLQECLPGIYTHLYFLRLGADNWNLDGWVDKSNLIESLAAISPSFFRNRASQLVTTGKVYEAAA
jgi:hypothetical protein